jgi:Fic family protein
VLVATEFVFRFLAIHPFQDGNGRIGRALFVLALLQADDPTLRDIAKLFSVDRQIERHKSLYYTVLQQTSGGIYRADPTAYRWEMLSLFFLKMLQESLNDVAILRAKYAALQRFSTSTLQVLACFRAAPEKRLRVTDIQAETGLVRRTVQNALTALKKAGFLQQQGAGAGTRYQLIF